MKQLLLLLSFLLFVGVQDAAARIPIGKVEKIKIVHEFPNTEEYMTNPGRFFDLGIKYEVFTIAGLPVWVTKQPEIVGTENLNKNFYMELTEEEKASILESHELNKDELTKLSFMQKHSGLSVIFLLIVAFIGYSRLPEPESDDVITEVEDTNEITT